MPVVSNNSSHALELLKQLDQGLNNGAHKSNHQAFDKALQMQSYNPNTLPGANTRPTLVPEQGSALKPQSTGQANTIPGQSTPPTSGTSTTQGATTSNMSMGASFNATGNLSTQNNLNDFQLLKEQNVLMQQVRALSQSISVSQAAALQPSVMLSLGMLQKFYEMIELRYKAKSQSMMLGANPNFAAQNADDLAAAQQAQVMSFVFMERFFKLFENGEKYNILSRFFKKGPLGENEHETNTDDEYGNSYADVDAETDYIKRPRRDKPGMAFHHSLLR